MIIDEEIKKFFQDNGYINIRVYRDKLICDDQNGPNKHVTVGVIKNCEPYFFYGRKEISSQEMLKYLKLKMFW